MRNYMFLVLFGLAAVCMTSHVQAGLLDPNTVVVTASSFNCCDPNQAPIHVSDWSGMIYTPDTSGNDVWQHDGMYEETMWLSGKKADSDAGPDNPGTVDGTHWIRFDFDKVYKLGKMLSWNYAYKGPTGSSVSDGPELYGMNNVTVEYSATGGGVGEWTTVYEGAFSVSNSYQRETLPAPVDTTVIFGGALVKSVVITSPVISTTSAAWNFRPGTAFMLIFMYNETEVGLAEVQFHITAPETCNEVNLFGFGLVGDADKDCYVTLADFADVAMGWLECVEPTDVDCAHAWEL